MTVDIEFECKKATVTGVKWDVVSVEVESVDVSEVLEAIGETKVFYNIALDDYIDWADGHSKLPDILERLNPEEIIGWLRENGHLEAA